MSTALTPKRKRHLLSLARSTSFHAAVRQYAKVTRGGRDRIVSIESTGWRGFCQKICLEMTPRNLAQMFEIPAAVSILKRHGITLIEQGCEEYHATVRLHKADDGRYEGRCPWCCTGGDMSFVWTPKLSNVRCRKCGLGGKASSPFDCLTHAILPERIMMGTALKKTTHGVPLLKVIGLCSDGTKIEHDDWVVTLEMLEKKI